MEFVTPLFSRRQLIQAGCAAGIASGTKAFALPRMLLEFPRDHGAHPDARTEWWYLTGYLNVQDLRAAFGFQVTFFRSRVPATQGMQSALAAKQLIFAHAAVTDVRERKLWHDQRIARSSGQPPGENATDVASCSTQTTAVVLRGWSLQRREDRLQAHVQNADFSLDLTCVVSQPLLLQGDQGLSRKGPDPTQASYYYSQPQLDVTGTVQLQGKKHIVASASKAWLDHEWSQQLLHPDAVGWDWIGINLFDGSALTAFRLRTKTGAALWDGGSFRTHGALRAFNRGEVTFQPVRTWQSPLSQAVYPVECAVHTPVGIYTVRASIDNQELDSRFSTGGIYWEGLCDVWSADSQLIGRGYLELTGYASPVRM